MSDAWDDAYSLLDTANKLVRQSREILVRDDFRDSWTDELTCISSDIEDYLSTFSKAWLEE